MPRAKQQEPAVTSAGTGAVTDDANGAAGPRQAVADKPPADKRHGPGRAHTAPVAVTSEHAAPASRPSAKRAAPSAEPEAQRPVAGDGAPSEPQHDKAVKHAKADADAQAAELDKATELDNTTELDKAGEQGKAGEQDKRRKPAAKAAKAPSATQAPVIHDAPGAPADEGRGLFLQHQRELLVAERNNYTRQAEELRAQAEALALEHEPGDVQFDEEGGEGGTANVDRELDLHLSAQARAAIDEIDAALAKIEAGTYGDCESCGRPIPEARLEALPHARLCVTCKSGGLTARRQ